MLTTGDESYPGWTSCKVTQRLRPSMMAKLVVDVAARTFSRCTGDNTFASWCICTLYDGEAP